MRFDVVAAGVIGVRDEARRLPGACCSMGHVRGSTRAFVPSGERVARLREGSVMSDARAELIAVAHAWDRAMVGNDADQIGRYMADDWTIIGPDGRVGGKDALLALVRSGDLTHDVMESHEIDVRVYGETAVVIARGVSGGAYQGNAFYLVERVSSVFVRQGRDWRCVATHLSLITEPAAAGQVVP